MNPRSLAKTPQSLNSDNALTYNFNFSNAPDTLEWTNAHKNVNFDNAHKTLNSANAPKIPEMIFWILCKHVKTKIIRFDTSLQNV